MICWVRKATVTACSEGSARASSMLLVCRDCVPPRTAASAWMATRTILFSACCAVRETPAVWVWKRINQELGFLAPKVSRNSLAQMRRAADIWQSPREIIVGVEEMGKPWRKGVDFQAASTAQRTYSKPSARVKANSWGSS